MGEAKEAKNTTEARDDASPGTLGALLYADRTQAVVPEQEWVALVAAIAEGDVRSLHALYQRTHRIVFTLIVRITANRETAEELTLDVFHDVWRRAATYDPANGTVVGWIMNQARSRAIDRLPFESRKKRTAPDPEAPEAALRANGPYEMLALEQQARLLRSALAALTPAERQAIEIAFFAGRTYEEVATQLNEPVGTVKSRIRSGLHKLRKTLTDGDPP